MSSKETNNDNLTKLADLFTVIHSPPPLDQGDGQYDMPLTSGEVGSGIIHDIEALGFDDFIKDIVFLVKLFARGNKPMDDSKLELEKLVQIMTKFPPNSTLLLQLEKLFISHLWSDIPKPQNMFANDYYRSADGSHYSRLNPLMGKSNTRYARSVRIERPLPLNLPDPGALFDTLMLRKEFKPHPSSISTMLFHLATIITHDLFDSSSTNPSINQTTSYLDLSPLYGRNLEEQMNVRQGRFGLLKPDTFSDRRVILQPPGVGCLLVIFSRNHNYIAKRLLQINERGRFSVNDPNDKEELKVQDEDLFQTARLINCSFYFQIIIHDYLHAILGLGLTQADSSWTLDPTQDFPKDTLSNPIPSGSGNQVSLEFNYIYRWHPTIGEDDTIWIEENFKKMLGKDYPQPGEEVPVLIFLKHLKEWREMLPADPAQRNIGRLERITEGDLKGTFRDTDITRELVHAADQIAGSFGANGIPHILRTVEILGITSARKMGICSLNELRRFLNFVPYKSFEEMNPDKEVANKLRMHYGHIDNVEMYPGVMIEKTKPSMLGSGIGLGYTISRAILSDAVNLVRNDRFNTDDHNVHNLTTWGYAEAQSDPTVASGSIIYKMILRNTQGCYKSNSIYAIYPFITPPKTKELFEKRGTVDQFDFSTPAILEEQQQKIHRILSYHGCREVLSTTVTFKVTYGADIDLITRGHFLDFDDNQPHIEKALYSGEPDKFTSDLKQFFLKTTQDLIDQKKISFDDQTYRIDAVRDICNLAPVHFVSEYLGVPLKTQESPRGVYTEQETYLSLATIYMFLAADLDPGQSFRLKKSALDISEQIHYVMKRVVDGTHESFIKKVAESVIGIEFETSPQATRVIRNLMGQYKKSDSVAWIIIITIASAVATIAQAASQIVDFYLLPENKSHLLEIQKLANKTDEESEKLILGYALEALRFYPAVPTLLRRIATSTSVDDKTHGTMNFRKDEEILVSLTSAHMDPSAFAQPKQVNPRRPLDSYLFFGPGLHTSFGKAFNFVAIPAIVKTILKLKNLQRTPGPAGQLNRIEEDQDRSIFVNDMGTIFPFPTDLSLEFTN